MTFHADNSYNNIAYRFGLSELISAWALVSRGTLTVLIENLDFYKRMVVEVNSSILLTLAIRQEVFYNPVSTKIGSILTRRKWV